MNHMKTIRKYIVFSFIGMTIATSCSDDKDEVATNIDKEVTFTTTVQTRALTNVITALKDGDAMGVYMTESNSVGADQQVKTNKVICQNGVWKGEPAIEMANGEKTYLFAAYPYQPTSSRPDIIPIDVKSQTDYLYSGSGASVSYDNPKAQLTMKHALSILAFNIKNENYAGEGKLQQISISGKPIYTSGTMNVSSGTVKGTSSGKYIQDCDATIQASGWEENIPDFFCIPFVSSGSDVTVTFKIDGEEYSSLLPKQGITGGMKYIFHLAFTSEGLILFPEQTKEISLNTDNDSMSLSSYSLLKVTHFNSSFKVPSYKGSGLIGKIFWGDGQEQAYDAAAEHSYGSDNSQLRTLTVETWGAIQEVALPDLIGISEIDISEF